MKHILNPNACLSQNAKLTAISLEITLMQNNRAVFPLKEENLSTNILKEIIYEAKNSNDHMIIISN